MAAEFIIKTNKDGKMSVRMVGGNGETLHHTQGMESGLAGAKNNIAATMQEAADAKVFIEDEDGEKHEIDITKALERRKARVTGD